MSALLDELIKAHERLDEKLAVHRDFVVGLEFERAMAALEDFESDLGRHMQVEERHLLPPYEARVAHGRGGDPRVFYLEHRNLLRHLGKVKDSLRALLADANAGRRQAHEFLHEEARFLRLLEHHDLRERRILYPRIDEVLSEEERSAVLDACRG